jgi:peptidoglycan hydrolase-like protein with peptidoglycan-binding domain
MTPGQARTALFTFLLVTVGVAFNALYLQTKPAVSGRAAAERPPPPPAPDRGRQTAKTAKTAEAGDAGLTALIEANAEPRPLRIARFAPDTSKIDQLPASTNQEAGAETIRAIQRELKLRGYGPIAGDGTMGLSTRAAIMAFEHDQGLALSGEASEPLLRRILLGAAEPSVAGGSGASGTGAGKVGSAQAEQVIRSVQQSLAALGYQPGRADGRLGEDTVKAIRDFEMDRGLVPRGRVSAELVTRLSEAPASRTSAR